MTQKQNNQETCPRSEIAAYIDGEITPWKELELEKHFAECKICRKELNSQKSLLLAVDAFREREKEIELPEDFTKVVVTTAESNVSGLRRPQERRKAFFISLALFLVISIGLGSESETVLATFRAFGAQLLAVGGFLAHLVFDIAVGVTVILRFIGHQFVFGSAFSFVFLAALFLIALWALSRLVSKYNRAKI